MNATATILANVIDTALTTMSARHAERCVWSKRELFYMDYLVARATVRVEGDGVAVVLPTGTARKKVGSAVYSLMEQALNDVAPWLVDVAVGEENMEGYALRW